MPVPVQLSYAVLRIRNTNTINGCREINDINELPETVSLTLTMTISPLPSLRVTRSGTWQSQQSNEGNDTNENNETNGVSGNNDVNETNESNEPNV